MLIEQEAFVREIAADPDSDVPRLIYADWLEERGDPQGEFIRVQCELARLPSDSPEIARLRSREAELLTEHRAAWVADVSAGIRWNSFRRGFVEEVILDGSALLTEGAQALRRAPIRELGIVLRTPEQVAALADAPEFRQLRKLRLGGSPLGDAGIQRLVQSKYFPQLEALWLTGCEIGPSGVAALASCAVVCKLERLILTNNPIGDDGARSIANSQVFANLQLLNLDSCGIGQAGVDSLCATAVLNRLIQPPIGGSWSWPPGPTDHVLVERLAQRFPRIPPADRPRPDWSHLPSSATQPTPRPSEGTGKSQLTVTEILAQARASARTDREPPPSGEEQPKSIVRSMFELMRLARKSPPPSP